MGVISQTQTCRMVLILLYFTDFHWESWFCTDSDLYAYKVGMQEVNI